ncbi:fasciclin domain-containing protein [Nocardioides bigeumensis]
MTRVMHCGVRRAVGAVLGPLVCPLVCVLAVMSLAACGGDDPEPSADKDQTSQSPTDTAPASPEPTGTTSLSATASDAAPPDDEPFGPDCKKFKTDDGTGPAEFRNEMDIGIFSVVFRDLIGDSFALVNEADLLATADTTYFLPTNEAIDVLNQQQMGDLLFDEQKRASTMGRHVVPETLAPSALAGEHETAAASTLQVTVDGDDVTVGLQGADVVCGNIELEQGVRVYVIDQLLIT